MVSVASVASYSSDRLFYTVGNFFILELFLTREICKKNVNDKKKKQQHTFHCQWMKAFKVFIIKPLLQNSTACNQSEIKMFYI